MVTGTNHAASKSSTVKKPSAAEKGKSAVTSPKQAIAGKKLQIIYPNGGEKLIMGKDIVIRWSDTTSKGTIVRVVLVDGNREVGIIDRNLPAKKGHCEWKTGDDLQGRPVPPGKNYRIAIQAEGTYSKYIKDVSDRVFTIAPEKQQPVPVPLLISRPLPGDTLYIGETYNIKWTAPRSSGAKASIYALRQEPARIFPIEVDVYNGGHIPYENLFSWNITGAQFTDKLGEYKIRIVTETGLTGESRIFRIAHKPGSAEAGDTPPPPPGTSDDAGDGPMNDLELAPIRPGDFRIERISRRASTDSRDVFRMYVTLRIRNNTWIPGSGAGSGPMPEIASVPCDWQKYGLSGERLFPAGDSGRIQLGPFISLPDVTAWTYVPVEVDFELAEDYHPGYQFYISFEISNDTAEIFRDNTPGNNTTRTPRFINPDFLD